MTDKEEFRAKRNCCPECGNIPAVHTPEVIESGLVCSLNPQDVYDRINTVLRLSKE